MLKKNLRQSHIDRLSKQECDLSPGISFLDVVNNLERIADHCSNVGMVAEQRIKATALDPHEYSKNSAEDTEEYKEILNEYISKYC